MARRSVHNGTINAAAASPALMLQPKAGRGRAGPLLHIQDVHNKKQKRGKREKKLTLHFTLQ